MSLLVILLVLMIIPVVALAIDRIIYWIQCELFPYRYGGVGVLNSAIEWGLHRWEDAKGLVFRPAESPSQPAGMTTAVSPAAPSQPAPSASSSGLSSAEQERPK